MRIKTKLRRIGNSQGVYIPKEVITGFKLGDEIELDVITKGDILVKSGQKVITNVLKERLETPEEMVANLPQREHYNTEPCEKHVGSMKGTCGCQ